MERSGHHTATTPVVRFIRRYGLFGLAAAAMVFIVVIPLAIVIVQGFISAQRGSWAFTLSHVALVLGRWPYWAALLNTIRDRNRRDRNRLRCRNSHGVAVCPHQSPRQSLP